MTAFTPGQHPQSLLRLEAGDVIDFLLAPAGDTTGDLTGFNALVRRAPDVTIAAPSEITAGQEVVVTDANNPALKVVS